MNIDFEELHVFDNSKSKYVPREMYEQAQADADRRLELLMRAKQYLKHDKDCTNHTFPDDNWCDCLLRVIIEDIEKELADAKKQ